MPRKPRIHVPGAFYHVTLRGNHRQDIFFSHDDRALLADIVSEVIQRFGAKVHAYCWMTNHIHLLLQVSEAPLGRLMLRIASRYARAVQSRFKTTGHLFECRYHALLVDADEYLLTLLRYIHLNPVEARIVSDVDEYAWSSHHAYVGTRVERWVTTEFALRMFHSDTERAVGLYRCFLNDESKKQWDAPMHQANPNDIRILGNDQFVASAQGRAWRPRSRKTVEQLIDEACIKFCLQREQLFGSDRENQVTRSRAWVAQQAMTLQIASIAHIARLFGRDESTLRKSMLRYFEPQ